MEGRRGRHTGRRGGGAVRRMTTDRGYIFPNPGHESESSASPRSMGGKNWPFHMMIRGEGGCPLLGWVDCPGRGSGLSSVGSMGLFPACHEGKQWR